MVDHFVHHGNPEGIGFWALLREDFATNGRELSAPGFRAIAVHRLGNARMQVRSKLLRAPLSLLYRRLYRWVRNVYGIELPYTVKLGRRVAIDHQSGIVIHGATELGDDVRIRQNVTMGVRTVDDLYGAPVIGNGVDVGAGAVILGRVQIGDRAVIGANAVVLDDVPAGALAVGVPARVVVREPDEQTSTSTERPAR
ncbi:MAG TPA: serine O-acetyltransferase [Acidimicrobiales bacterium]